ncbi:hypothetical protein D3C84_276080 [compost metagenome]
MNAGLLHPFPPQLVGVGGFQPLVGHRGEGALRLGGLNDPPVNIVGVGRPLQGGLALEVRICTAEHLSLGIQLLGAVDHPATVERLHAGVQGSAQIVEVGIAYRRHLGAGRVDRPSRGQGIVRILDHHGLDRECAPRGATGIARTAGVSRQGLAAIGQQAGHDPSEDVVLEAADEAIGIGLAQQIAIGVVVGSADAVPQHIALADGEQVQGCVVGGGQRRLRDLLRWVGAEVRPYRLAGDVAPGIPGVAGHHLEIRVVGFRDFLRYGPGRGVVHPLRLGDQHRAALGMGGLDAVHLADTPGIEVRGVIGVLVEGRHRLDGPICPLRLLCDQHLDRVAFGVIGGRQRLGDLCSRCVDHHPRRLCR